MLHRLSLPFVLAGLTFLPLVGCNPSAPAPETPTESTAATPAAGGVAILDINKLASALGRDKTMETELQGFATSQAEQVRVQIENINAQIRAKAENFGGDPEKYTEEQRRELQNMLVSRNRLVEQQRLALNQNAQRERNQLFERFRNEIEPIAKQVAADRGLSIILLNSPAVLFAEEAVDITDEVILEAQRTLGGGSSDTSVAPEGSPVPDAGATTP